MSHWVLTRDLKHLNLDFEMIENAKKLKIKFPYTSVVKSAHRAAQTMQESLSHAFCMDDKSAELGANMKQLLHTVLRAGNHRAGLESSSRKNQTHEQILGALPTLQNEQDAVKG
ncbi:hypothetical protein R1sor_006517 [Riccia sorocarpa]|uniref:Uncharacterized protein n=1 Tax=Riccia sorocarpa TaxID=122646 RepID=A0ABD3HPJ4_9MARC